jgi:OPA family glycerol-3-phosphate transporter-like MFS transporter/OPA family sugar phosphate sensor protein UhpC-like MFS transporter
MATELDYAPRRPARTGLFGWLRPDPPAEIQITDPQAIAEGFRRGQFNVLLWSIVGYALFYFVRNNLSTAMPVMEEKLGIGKPQLGLFLTLHQLLYGISKFFNGFVGDRVNARTFMAAGLILSALANVAFGFSSAVVVFGVVWMLNGWFQGMGFPPCARVMTHWFPPTKLASRMSIWNTSHSIGMGCVAVLCGYLVGYSWRLCFFVPAALAFVAALVLLMTLHDTPASVGLPDVEGTETAAGDLRPTDDATDAAQSGAAFRSFVRKHVFGNKYIWIFSIANFFVYVIRYGILNWGSSMLYQSKGIKLSVAGLMLGAFELSGVAGSLCSGWITDRVFGGRGARTCTFSMIGCGIAVLLLWRYPGRSIAPYTAILCAIGFFIYGPQGLAGICAANLATKRAAATAVGLTGLFGYGSTVLSGWGFGKLVDRFGWERGFLALLIVAICGVIAFALAWPAKAHGYAEPEPQASATDPAAAGR